MIDPTKQVKLLKLAVKGGNLYHPRIYNPGELPDEIMAREDILDQSFLTPSDPVTTPTINKSDSVLEEKASFKPVEPQVQSAPYPVQAVVIDKNQRVDINRATVEELAKLPHIGIAIAGKLDKERDKQPFHSIEDLNTRIPLRGHDWEEVKDQILLQ